VLYFSVFCQSLCHSSHPSPPHFCLFFAAEVVKTITTIDVEQGIEIEVKVLTA